MLAGLQGVPPLPHFLGRTRRRIHAIVELAIAGFDQSLMQITLGEIARQIIGREGRSLRARLRHRRFALLPGGFARPGVGTRRGGRRAPKADKKPRGNGSDPMQASFTR